MIYDDLFQLNFCTLVNSEISPVEGGVILKPGIIIDHVVPVFFFFFFFFF